MPQTEGGATTNLPPYGYPMKSAAQLDREISIALANTRREADVWDVAMDAILEHDPKRAAQIAHEITGDGVIDPPSSFLNALHEVPTGVRSKFEEAVTAWNMPKSRFAIGDRVTGRSRFAEHHDTGRVIGVDGERATVAWDSNITTTQDDHALRSE